MKSSENLYDLIKSLSPTEKRYIKVAAKKSFMKKPEFMKLFDVLDKMTEYDENKIKESLKNSSIINYLHSHKNYLQEYILKNLSYFKTNKNTLLELNEILNFIEVLFCKSQYELCHKYIKRGIKIAESLELNNYVLQFLAWEQKLYIPNKKGIPKIIYNIKNQLEYSYTISETARCKGAYTELLSLVWNAGIYADASNSKNINDLYSFYRLNDKPNNKYSEASYYYNMAFYVYNSIFLRYKERILFLNNALTILEENPKLLQKNIYEYINTLINFSIAHQTIGKFEDGIDILEKAKDFWSKNTAQLSTSTMFLARVKIAETTIYINTVSGNIDNAILLKDEVNELLTLSFNEGFTPNLLNLTYGLAWAYFLKGDFEKCLDYTSEIIFKYKEGYRDDLFIACRMLSLMAHYELNNFYFLESSLLSFKKYLKNNRKLFLYESVLIDFFIKTIQNNQKNKNKVDNNFLLKDLHKKIHNDKQLIGKMSVYIDLDSWIESKLTNKPLLPLFVERFKFMINENVDGEG